MEYINLKAQYEKMKSEIDARVLMCMNNADFIMGDAVSRFEKNLAEYVGVKYAVGCGNGTDALQLVYMAYGIGEGDAVFCPAMTFIASVEPACLLGATPVFCEIDMETYNIVSDSLERQIKKVKEEGKLNARAIVAVDFLGNPANYKELCEIAQRHGLLLIEDAAQSIGASYCGKMCGSFGDIATTSFFPSKPLGCYGDGGAVLTNNEEVARKIESLRIHGKGKNKYDNIYIGVNSRLDTIQAEILDVKIKYLRREIENRQKIAQKYNEALEKYVKVPYVEKDSISAYAQYVILLEDNNKRNELKKYLEDKNIPTIIYYPNPLHCLPVFEGINVYHEELGNSELYGNINLGLPFSPYLSENEQDYVIREIVNFFEGEK